MKARILKLSDLDEEQVLAEVTQVIDSGRLAVIPTETVYGLAARIDDPDVIELIYRAKSRDRGKPIPILASGPEILAEKGYVLNVRERLLAEAFWPGALTMVLEADGTTEGVRVPDHSLVRRILQACGGLLRVTSANQSGEKAATSAAMAIEALGEHVDLIIDAGDVTGGIASTVVNCSNEGFDILREGAINSARIERVLENL